MLKRKLAGFALSALCVKAFSAEAQPTATVSGVSAGGIVQMLLGLVVVLAMVGVAAWLLKRVMTLRGSEPGPIQVISSTAVGQRERVVLVEVGDTWLLVGVAPGQVRTLHSMPRTKYQDVSGTPSPQSTGPAFATWLRHLTARRTDV
jgi:flagellar protein FliO/FliZ